VGRDRLTGTARHRSFTVHGTRLDAEVYRDHVLAEAASARLPSARHLLVGQLLRAWLDAEQDWRPSTRVGYRSVVNFLTGDPLGDPLGEHQAAGLIPHVVRTAITRWESDGAGIAVISGRLRVLRSALSWAWSERILPTYPLRGMRGPGRPAPRRPLPDQALGALLATAEIRLLEAHANQSPSQSPSTTAAVTPGATWDAAVRALHRAEEDLLLVRLAADTGPAAASSPPCRSPTSTAGS
jgi:hypothetical protein